MRNLLAEGRKNADSTTFHSSELCARSIEEGMLNIVQTYQSSFSSNSTFATSLNKNMTVSRPTRALISAAGKQRFKRSKETNSIIAMKKDKLLTVSTVQNLDIPMEQRKNPPELPAPFTEIVMGVNGHVLPM